MAPIVEPELEAAGLTVPQADPGSLAVHGRGSGHPVCFLTVNPAVPRSGSRLQSLLTGCGVRTLALDRPGYGNTSLEAGGFRHNANVLTEVLAHLGTPAVVVAHSWAAGPALLTARRTPEMISGLVLCAAGRRPSVGDRARPRAGPRAGRPLRAPRRARGGWMAGGRPGGEHLLTAAGLGHLPPAEARSATQPALDRRARRAAAVEQIALVEESGRGRPGGPLRAGAHRGARR